MRRLHYILAINIFTIWIIVGLVFVRPYFNKLKDDWFIHWVKVSFPRNGETGGDCSYFKISQHELPELIELLSQLEKEISSQPRGKLIPRLANSKYSTFEDRNDVARFWAKDHCVYLKSGKLALRQHRNSENTYTIRMWSPREEKFGWHGMHFIIIKEIINDEPSF